MLLDNQKMSSYINFESWTADQVAEWLRGSNTDTFKNETQTDKCSKITPFTGYVSVEDPTRKADTE